MTTKRIYKILEEWGLAKNETTIYLEAIKHAEISPFKLARLTKIPRTTVYDIMMNLALKGLITIKTNQGLEKKQTWIVAKNPSVLREAIFKRRDDLMKLEVDLVDILADIKKEYIARSDTAHFQFYPGKEGIARAYDLIRHIPLDVPVYFFDHLMPMDSLGKKYINEDVAISLQSANKRKRVKTLMPLNDWTRHVLTYQYGRNPSYIEYHKYRYIENPAFDLQHDMYIFSDKVVMIAAKNDEMWALVITSKLAALSFRSLFQTLWHTAHPVTKSFVKSLGENEFLKAEKKSSW